MEPVYYKIDNSSFPSESPEGFRFWVGVAEHVGAEMTYNIWSKDTGKYSIDLQLDQHNTH